MYQSINVHQFRQAFIDMDRKENFSYAGLGALFNFLEDLADDTGNELELDVIAICCDFSEHTIEEIIEEYSNMIDKDAIKDLDKDELHDYIVEWLEDHTMVIPVEDTGRVIIQAF